MNISPLLLGLGGLAMGVMVSATVHFINNFYHSINKSVDEFMRLKGEELDEKFFFHNKANEKFINEKMTVMDQKLSLLLSRLTTSSSGGSYKTTVAIDKTGHTALKDMMDDVGKEIANNYKDALKKYGERKEKDC